MNFLSNKSEQKPKETGGVSVVQSAAAEVAAVAATAAIAVALGISMELHENSFILPMHFELLCTDCRRRRRGRLQRQRRRRQCGGVLKGISGRQR